MPDFRFTRFDWDAGNSTKSHQKHGITKEAIEAFFANDDFVIVDDDRHSGSEQRLLAVGQTKIGRWMLVSFTIRSKAGKRYLRTISARYMHAKEVKRYENLH